MTKLTKKGLRKSNRKQKAENRKVKAAQRKRE